MLRALILFFLVSAGSVSAQSFEERLQVFADDLEICFFTGGTVRAQKDCIGDMATNCMDAEEGGHTTIGMSMCLSNEAEVWDGLLNREYKATMAWAKAADEDESEHFPEYANRAQALRAAQRAWIGFRDAECELSYTLWGAGSMRHIAGSDCIMEITAERAIELRAMREPFE